MNIQPSLLLLINDMNISPGTFIAVGGVVGFSILLLMAALRWQEKEYGMRTLVVFLLTGLVWCGGRIAYELNSQNNIALAEVAISQTFLPVLVAALTLAFTQKIRQRWWALGVGTALVSLWVLWYLDIGGLVTAIIAAFPIVTHQGVNDIGYGLIWGVSIIVTIVALWHAHHEHPQIQYSNRYWYWFGGVVMFIIANGLFIMQRDLFPLAHALMIAGISIIGYTALNYYPPALALMVTRTLRSLTVTIAVSIFIFFALSVAYLMTNWGITPGSALVWLVALALGLGIFLPILARSTERTFGSMLFGRHEDEFKIVRAYSQTVKTDWDFYKLSQQSLRFILQEIGVERGAIFLIHGDGTRRATVTLAAGAGMQAETNGIFPYNDPWFVHLKTDQTLISRFDLEMLPKFRTVDAEARVWLDALNADMFVPMVLRQDELIGVLALGEKPGYHSFTPRDLRQLHALVMQVALDLDKARLFGQLGQINQKFGELSEEFTTIDRNKTDFISIASHELRTPLTHIHGYASMLLEATGGDLQDPAYLQHVLDGIARGSTRLKEVVDLIFDVSKADYGILNIARSPLKLNDVVTEATEEQSGALEKRNHTLIVSGIDQLPNIQGDMLRLVQAVSQLLNNAIKYTPDNGTITITGRSFEQNGHENVELIITDTGIGINPEDHQRIFSKFYRVDDVAHHSTSSVNFKGAGPGLGLPLVKGIAKAHGGDVWVDSPECNEETYPGSQFHLLLPLKAPVEPQKKNKDDDEPSKQETRRWTKEDMRIIKEKIQKYRRVNDEPPIDEASDKQPTASDE